MPLYTLSQTDVPATVLTDIYTHGTTRPDVTALTPFCAIRGISVCNRTASQITFRLSVAMGGAADNAKQYVYYDAPVLPNETFNAQTLLPLEYGDVVRVYTSAANVTVQLHGES
jgi:hypothetical protein